MATIRDVARRAQVSPATVSRVLNNASVVKSATRARVVKAMDHYIRIHDLTDEEAAKLIRSHEIDILIDLSGHTPNNRLLVFAAKPAPLQIAWTPANLPLLPMTPVPLDE